MAELPNILSISQVQKDLKSKKYSTFELVNQLIERIEKHNPVLNAVVFKDYEDARKLAKEADERIAKGEMRLLDGIPGMSKHLFCQKNKPIDACSKILDGFIAPYESTVTGRLKDAGVIMLGSANMDEFAMGSANANSRYGEANSPWVRKSDGKRVIPGGSSGGSSASVSASFSVFAMGSDTGGSVRQPAALTGLVGIKPTYGRCSRYGMIPFASSFDTAGVLTNNVDDAAILMRTMAGHDTNDSTCLNVPVEDYLARIDKGVKGLRVGIPIECSNFAEMNQCVVNSWKDVAKRLENAGAIVKEVSLKNIKHGIAVYYALASAEASSNLSKYDGIRYGSSVNDPKNLEDLYIRNRVNGFGDEVKRRIFLGTYVLSSESDCDFYNKARRVRNIIYKDFHDAFQEIDVILMPTTPDVARAADEKVSVLQNYISDILTVPVSVAGMPAISVPTGIAANGLPIGMQIVANKFQEGLLFQVAKEIENQIQFQNLEHNKVF